jgi:hypothetical protein
MAGVYKLYILEINTPPPPFRDIGESYLRGKNTKKGKRKRGKVKEKGGPTKDKGEVEVRG